MASRVFILFKTAVVAFAVIFMLFTVAIPANSRGVKSFYGHIYDVARPGLTVKSPFVKIDSIVTGFDTDFKENIICKTWDNVYIRIPRIYVDNEFDCKDDKCIIDLYTRYFITDAKTRSKYTNKYVPEDGMIFKYIPEVMTEVCQMVTAYQTQTNKWVALFPIIQKKLQERVPKGIKIHAVRMDRPDVRNLEWHTSVIGMTCNWWYGVAKRMYEFF